MIKKFFENLICKNKSKIIEENRAIELQENIQILTNEVIERLERKDLYAIIEAYLLLYNQNEKIKLRIVGSIHKLVASLNVLELVKIDSIFRERTSLIWNYNFKEGEPEDLLHASMSENEKATILGLSTFHTNGHFREKAIKSLDNIRTGQELSYLLIRVNDWVKSVRDISKAVTLQHLAQGNVRYIINNLPLIFRLKDCYRDEHYELINIAVKILSQKENLSELEAGITSENFKVRLYCYEILVHAKVLDNKSIVNYLLKEKNPYTRLFILRQVQKNIVSYEFNEIRTLLLKDKSAQIRVIALENEYKFNSFENISVFEEALLDDNSSVRQVARYILNKEKKYDFRKFYCDALTIIRKVIPTSAIGGGHYLNMKSTMEVNFSSEVVKNSIVDDVLKSKSLYGVICGIGETGCTDDVKLIAQFLEYDSIKIIRATMVAIAKLDFDNYKEFFMSSLSHGKPGISKLARKLLYKKVDFYDAKKVYEIFKSNDEEYIKTNSAALLCFLTKWVSIIYIIEICADSNLRVSKLGKYALEKWKISLNNSFLPPSKQQLGELKNVLYKFDKQISHEDRKFIEFMIKDF